MSWILFFFIITIGLTLFITILFLIYYFKGNHADGLPKMTTEALGNPALVSMDKMLREAHYSPKTGELIFDYPKTMKTGKEYSVQTKISGHFEKIITKNESEIYEIPISDIMMCTLKGDSFKINPVNNSNTQLVLDNQITNWYWNVIPLSLNGGWIEGSAGFKLEK